MLLSKKVAKELDNLVEKKVITPVEEPTELTSQMAVADRLIEISLSAAYSR